MKQNKTKLWANKKIKLTEKQLEDIDFWRLAGYTKKEAIEKTLEEENLLEK